MHAWGACSRHLRVRRHVLDEKGRRGGEGAAGHVGEDRGGDGRVRRRAQRHLDVREVGDDHALDLCNARARRAVVASVVHCAPHMVYWMNHGGWSTGMWASCVALCSRDGSAVDARVEIKDRERHLRQHPHGHMPRARRCVERSMERCSLHEARRGAAACAWLRASFGMQSARHQLTSVRVAPSATSALPGSTKGVCICVHS